MDRYAVSVLWEFDEDMNLLKDRTWLGRTIIRSLHALTYGQVRVSLTLSHHYTPYSTQRHISVERPVEIHPPHQCVYRSRGSLFARSRNNTCTHNTTPSIYDINQADRLIQGRHADAQSREPVTIDPCVGGACGDPVPRDLESRLRDSLRHISKLAGMRASATSSLNLESSELDFELDEDGNPKSVHIHESALGVLVPLCGCVWIHVLVRLQQRQFLAQHSLELWWVRYVAAKTIHDTIAQMMIFANSTVAEFIFKAFPDRALLRIHDEADASKFSSLKATASTAVRLGVVAASPVLASVSFAVSSFVCVWRPPTRVSPLTQRHATDSPHLLLQPGWVVMQQHPKRCSHSAVAKPHVRWQKLSAFTMLRVIDVGSRCCAAVFVA